MKFREVSRGPTRAQWAVRGSLDFYDEDIKALWEHGRPQKRLHRPARPRTYCGQLRGSGRHYEPYVMHTWRRTTGPQFPHLLNDSGLSRDRIRVRRARQLPWEQILRRGAKKFSHQETF